MPLNFSRARPLLQQGNLKQLFVEELGWEPCRQHMDVTVGERSFRLTGVAEKKGFVVWQCESQDGTLPDHATRLKLDRQVTQTTFEHLLVFVTRDGARQSWMWVRREPGRPVSARTHEYLRGQPGDSLLQKLQLLFVSLDEEEAGLSVAEIAARARTAFNVDRVVKRYYEQFRKEHAAFLKFITGISDTADHEWYASVMLNRLMFVYFVQRKGFLDGDPDYLRNRLQRMRKEHGKDKFYSFYRYFLLRLFHEGLGGRKRSPELEELLGKIPYLNGGIFDIHELERPDRYGKVIQIPDKAFERIFDFFDQWHWHLDDRPLRADNEINPDVLGYIYEKYVNQKQMGAYYTKEDITEYISKNTIIPFLFDAARAKCKVAFENPGGPTVWDLLKNDPDRYIYPAVKHGISWDYYDQKKLDEPRPLPPEIEKGVNPPTLHQPVGDGPILTLELRKDWNKPAPSEYALPTEIWREVVARRQRCDELRRKLAAGEVRDINDLITLNLDIRQFAQDVIETCEGLELLRAFWHAIEKVTVLDPTCGSGAFLFAALNILEPLYEACLDRMEGFLQDDAAKADPAKLKRTPHGYPLLSHGKYEDFSKVLEHVAEHPSRHYFIYKSIILNNLFGVDIMEEAVEICKLRLFLKLAAQVEADATKPNFGIEPLPDIDFNIRAGNTLVGFASMDEIRRALGSDLVKQLELPAIESKAADADRAFQLFHEMQSERGMNAKDFVDAKRKLRDRLKALEDELNRYLAADYGVKPQKKAEYDQWVKSHQPFHWLIDFYGILNDRGGFDVIIGNPPYLELREIEYGLKNYACLESGAVHAMCVERSVRLLQSRGCMSMIVPLSLPSTQRMKAVQELLEAERSAWYANFAWRPAKLFDTVNRALTIFVIAASGNPRTHSTDYQKWTSDNREGLFQRLSYIPVPRQRPAFWIPKLGDGIEANMLARCLAVKTTTMHFVGPSDHCVYYRCDGGLYWKVFTDFPPAFKLNGKVGHSSRETCFTVIKREHARPIIAALSSNTFWWWYTVTSNLRHLNPYDVQNFRLPEAALADTELRRLSDSYIEDINVNSTMLVREQRQTGRTETQSFKIQKSKPILDHIDRVLARYYGFTEEELDFIINYDIKYRMGRDSGERDE